jgi:hypothetical protein
MVLNGLVHFYCQVMAAAQAVKIGMNRDVSASVLKNVAELQAGSRNPKLQGHTYEILTQYVHF